MLTYSSFGRKTHVVFKKRKSHPRRGSNGYPTEVVVNMLKSALRQGQQIILNVLEANPQGLTLQELRQAAGVGPHEQGQFGRRVRELRAWYNLPCIKKNGKYVYILKGEKPNNDGFDPEPISPTQAARIRNRDGYRCQSCGKTPGEDGVKLHIDHKIPRSWGGSREDSNLWTLCSECNEGKKNLFASYDAEQMKQLMKYQSVHKRIAELLHMYQGQWVDSDLIEFVANAVDWQQDWQKRLRELRYPVIGLDIESRRAKRGTRFISQYKLNNWVVLPNDPSAASRHYEQERAKANRSKKP